MSAVRTPSDPTPRKARGFSLIEITLAMGIAAVAMVSILGMLPQAMKASRSSVDQTAIGAVLEDVHDRLEGQVLKEGDIAESPFYYDEQGRRWVPQEEDSESVVPERFFKVAVSLKEPRSVEGITLPEGLLAAVVDLSWPLDEFGMPRGAGQPKTTVTYMVTTLTGPDWQLIEPEFEPKVEY